MAFIHYRLFWVAFFAVLYLHVLGIIPAWLYLLLVGPAILYHISTLTNVDSVSEMEHADTPPRKAEQPEERVVTIDDEFTERVDLDIGGYIELEYWIEREVPQGDVRHEELVSQKMRQMKQ